MRDIPIHMSIRVMTLREGVLVAMVTSFGICALMLLTPVPIPLTSLTFVVES